MKISGLGTVQGIRQSQATKGAAKTEQARSEPGVQVQMSKEASWISELQSSARGLSNVRADVVKETKAQLANGTFESSIDMSALVDNLLGEL